MSPTPWPTPNVYTEISKRLGWDGSSYTNMKIPSRLEAQQVASRCGNRSQEAFEQLFKWVRFCSGPRNQQEVEALEIVVRAFRGNSEYWKSQEVRNDRT